ncbi:MAG: ribosome silencing factor [Rhodobacteraceae bacterium]|nr:ribosome silencing factor [Paracoccaceae bacterium]MCY4249384.1 ribosome silencing factor [Paracoccaceae bacterium]MCY4307263.1 ribosome silencing factor [Paracoccaceae bacterium]
MAPLPSPENLLELVLKVLDDNLAQETVEIDLRGKSTIADYMVVASGRSKRQVVSLSEKLLESLKRKFKIQTTIEGKEGGDWVLIDAGDVIIHLFRPEVRNFYQIEKLWMPNESRAKDNI